MNKTQCQLNVAMTSRVLELNAGFEAIRFRSGLSALKNLIKGRAEAIRTRFENGVCVDWAQLDWDEWAQLTPRPEDVFIGTFAHAVIIPRTIVSVKYPRVPRRTIRMTRSTVYARDGGLCQYCAKPVSLKAMQLEHVHPSSRGGKTTWENIVAACVACNQKKADRTPQEAGMRLVRAPKAPPPVSSTLFASESTGCAEWDMYLHITHDRVTLTS